MRVSALAAVLVGSSIGAGLVLGCSPPAGLAVGAGAPSLTGVDWWPGFALAEMPTTFTEPPLKGRVVVLEFFASW